MQINQFSFEAAASESAQDNTNIHNITTQDLNSYSHKQFCKSLYYNIQGKGFILGYM